MPDVPNTALALCASLPTLPELRSSFFDTPLGWVLKAQLFGEVKQCCDFDVLRALLAPGPQLGAAAIWGRHCSLPILPDPAAQPGTGL